MTRAELRKLSHPLALFATVTFVVISVFNAVQTEEQWSLQVEATAIVEAQYSGECFADPVPTTEDCVRLRAERDLNRGLIENSGRSGGQAAALGRLSGALTFVVLNLGTTMGWALTAILAAVSVVAERKSGVLALSSLFAGSRSRLVAAKSFAIVVAGLSTAVVAAVAVVVAVSVSPRQIQKPDPPTVNPLRFLPVPADARWVSWSEVAWLGLRAGAVLLVVTAVIVGAALGFRSPPTFAAAMAAALVLVNLWYQAHPSAWFTPVRAVGTLLELDEVGPFVRTAPGWPPLTPNDFDAIHRDFTFAFGPAMLWASVGAICFGLGQWWSAGRHAEFD